MRYSGSLRALVALVCVAGVIGVTDSYGKVAHPSGIAVRWQTARLGPLTRHNSVFFRVDVRNRGRAPVADVTIDTSVDAGLAVRIVGYGVGTGTPKPRRLSSRVTRLHFRVFPVPSSDLPSSAHGWDYTFHFVVSWSGTAASRGCAHIALGSPGLRGEPSRLCFPVEPG